MRETPCNAMAASMASNLAQTERQNTMSDVYAENHQNDPSPEQENDMPSGSYLTKPQFGIPTDDIERTAVTWLEANAGTTGESVMKSLAAVIRAEIERHSTLPALTCAQDKHE
jgi:hypothetical protein